MNCYSNAIMFLKLPLESTAYIVYTIINQNKVKYQVLSQQGSIVTIVNSIFANTKLSILQIMFGENRRSIFRYVASLL